jgi:hypothetical protein
MRGLLVLVALILSPVGVLAQSPVAGNAQATIAGNALYLLPDTNNGEVEVIAHGEPSQHGFIPIVVRNNTNDPVVGATAQVAVRDNDDKLVGVGETLMNHALKPYWLNPGDVAIGFISLDGEMPEGASFEYSATASAPGGFMDDVSIDVEFYDVNWLPNRIVGEFVNPSDRALSSTYLMVTCFDDDGTPVASDVSAIDLDIKPGTTALFQMGGVFADLSVCERFLIAGTGHPV